MGYNQYLVNFDRKEYIILGKAGEDMVITILKHMITNYNWIFTDNIELVSYLEDVEKYVKTNFKHIDINYKCQSKMIEFLYTL